MTPQEAVHQLCLPQIAHDGDCGPVSHSLAELLDGKVVLVWGWVEEGVLAFVHLAVRVNGLIVDATATQFDPRLPMPIVSPVDDYCAQMAEATGVERVTVTDSR